MVEIGYSSLNLEGINDIVFKGKKIVLSDELIEKVEESYKFLTDFSKDKVIYGINTGFGPMAQYKIEEKDQLDLQYNLIRSHSSGFGKPISPQDVKASMIARMNTLSLGYSGVHLSAVTILKEFINNDITPLIFEHGGVGASGDLVQLAHLALVMIGEGKVFYKGELRPTAEVLKELDIEPMKVHLREGLAIMNGTSVMTGIGIVNSIYAQRAIEWSIASTLMICEMVDSYDDYFSRELNHSKKHVGQQQVASILYDYMNDSQYIRKRESSLYRDNSDKKHFEDKVQEYYSLRCVPQIVGTILETVKQSQKLLVEEINSANDNPIVDVKARNVLHGGNFHGDYVSFEMDKLKIAITKLSMLAERQINFLMNPALNGLLPPFANLGKLGFNFGMQGVQFTATSTTAENQTLSTPMYIHSIPNNNDNQDIVSMGTNAATITRKVIDNTFEVLAIELISIVQSLDLIKKTDGLSAKSKECYNAVRNIVPKFTNDYPIYEDLERVKKYLLENSPIENL
ncbi:aromatic amino acid ammonia-lyase [Mangrovivirga sp. M17]|uniref:Aromatic amino acid ammonia-lyase n=1 Tax=Mangrovivirga halotolerans TaxID=2993936 RepID=A0ABT3RUT2_9BACT|nr:aromatic amino acid ammonia-lyase [Mangrovivirga halotolerans]MCX2745383.1 aromatic amino acid ammonia-lyase [Mangrovivirga halotolerans]